MGLNFRGAANPIIPLLGGEIQRANESTPLYL
jgi:hypothetical protein